MCKQTTKECVCWQKDNVIKKKTTIQIITTAAWTLRMAINKRQHKSIELLNYLKKAESHADLSFLCSSADRELDNEWTVWGRIDFSSLLIAGHLKGSDTIWIGIILLLRLADEIWLNWKNISEKIEELWNQQKK